MINVSNACRAKIRANSKVVGIGNIDFADSVHLELSGADFMANTIGYSQASSSTSSFDIGAAIIGKMSFSLNNYNGKFNSYDFTGSQITSWIGVPLESTTELIKKGVFNIQQPDSYGTTISLTAYDNMSKLQKPYSEVNTSYPATLQSIAVDIALHCGVQLKTSQFPNYTYVVDARPDDKSISCLDMIAYVAQISGCFAICDTDGRIVFKWYDMGVLNSSSLDGGAFDIANPYATGDNADGGNFTDYSSGDSHDGGSFEDEYFTLYAYTGLKVATDDVVVTGIRVTVQNDDAEYLYGNSGYVLEAKDNPLITSAKAASVAEYLGLRNIGMRFRPFSMQAQSDPTMEPGDCCYIYDRNNNLYRSVITSVNYNVGNRTSIACNAQTPARNNASYFSQLAKTVTRIENGTKRELSNYDKQVQAMNRLALNAVGFYPSSEKMPDGSVIEYMHDKPTIAESTIVYKETIDGFFLSQDGGETYIYGRDSNGNVIVNILSAIGIQFDWAKGGTLTLGGDNDVSGVAVVLDGNGEECVRLDKNGLKTHSAEITGGKIDIQTNSDDALIILRGEATPHYMRISRGGMTAHGESFLADFSSIGIIMSGANGVAGFYGGQMYIERESGMRLSITGRNTGNEVDLGNGNRITAKTNGEATVLLGGIKHYHSNTYSYTIFEDVTINGNLAVSGTKPRVAATENYAKRLLYCYEMPKPYFGDIGEAVLDETGICYVQMDDIFFETVNTSCNYQVFLQKYGRGDLWIKERTPTHFIVEGTPNLSFAWELKARQAGFEYERLDKFERPSNEESIDYELEAANYVTNFYKELEKYEESN